MNIATDSPTSNSNTSTETISQNEESSQSPSTSATTQVPSISNGFLYMMPFQNQMFPMQFPQQMMMNQPMNVPSVKAAKNQVRHKRSKNKFSASNLKKTNQISFGNFIDQNNKMIQNQILSNSLEKLNAIAQKKAQKGTKIIIEDIIERTDLRTTLMLRNVPNKYTKQEIVDEIGQEFWGKYDCLNLPMDYSTNLNLGYAFINFTCPFHIIKFFSVLLNLLYNHYHYQLNLLLISKLINNNHLNFYLLYH